MQPIISARDPNEPNRSATTLELLFDLVYVIAVSAAVEGFYHHLSSDALHGVITFTLAFFILWNAWTSFTWFGSGYDPDDSAYRLSILAQIFGSLMIAANIHNFFSVGLTWVGVVGYAIMRLASCTQWWRVYKTVTNHRTIAKRSITGLLILQSLWVSWLFLPHNIQTPALFIFIIAELIMPIWARSDQLINWNPEHLAERYGLMTIIVLGEGILGVSTIMQNLLNSSYLPTLHIMILCAILTAILFFSWWLYFEVPFDRSLKIGRQRYQIIIFGYGHFFIFTSLAGLGGAFNLVIDVLSSNGSENHSTQITPTYAVAMVAIQLLAFLVTLTALRQWLCQKSHCHLAALCSAGAVILFAITITLLGAQMIYGLAVCIFAPIILLVLFNHEQHEHISLWTFKR